MVREKEAWETWEIDEWKVRRKFKAEDLTKARQLKKAEHLTRDDVLGARHYAKGVYCHSCEKEWSRGALTVCNECIEYFCDDHIGRHSNCPNGR